jgi:octaprenyl-diphosphate synthase
MSLSIDAAIGSLRSNAKHVDDARLESRLTRVQELLGEEMVWVEQALEAASSHVDAPASSAIAHLISGGGKRIRPLAVLLSAACSGSITPTVRQLAAVVELIHTATLLHDDVIDEGMERRGAPTARRIWGNAASVLAGDSLLVHSLESLHQFAPQLLGSLLGTLHRLVAGEVIQLRNRADLDVSIAGYERVLRDKTASLFQFATSAGAQLGGANLVQQQVLGEFGERLGMAFQLVDDVLDYVGVDTGKTIGADLLEGKVTLPLVYALQRNPGLMRLVAEVRVRAEPSLVEQLRAEVVATDACSAVRERARAETEGAAAAIASVPDSAAKRLLIGIAEQLVSRSG